MDTEKARLLELRKKIDELSYQYYTLDKPTVTDYEYDMMYRELENIEKAHPDWVTPDSPTQRVGSKISGGFEKYTHDRPMLSLGDVFSDDELREFDQRVRSDLGGESLEYVVELKIDGLAVNLIYEQGQFIRGVHPRRRRGRRRHYHQRAHLPHHTLTYRQRFAAHRNPRRSLHAHHVI